MYTRLTSERQGASVPGVPSTRRGFPRCIAKLATLADLPRMARHHGTWPTFRMAWRRRHPSYRQIIIFGLTRPRAIPVHGAPHVTTFRFASPEEATALGRMSPEDTAVALRSGDRCLLHFDRDTLVGSTWEATSPVVLLTEGLYLPLPSDAAYIYNSHTLPEHRGRGGQTLRHLELRLRTGRARLLCYVDVTNLDSLRGVNKAGYEPIGEARFDLRGPAVRTMVRLDRGWWTDVRRL